VVIYKATNLINGKTYIGQTIYSLKKRKREHGYQSKRGCDLYFHRAIYKYGIENFKWEEMCCCFDIKGLNEMEVYFVTLCDSFKNGYNMTYGGNNSLHSEETKQKMSRNSARAFLNKHHTEETKRRISRNNPNRGKPGTMLNKKHSAATKLKISKSVKKYFANKQKTRTLVSSVSGDYLLL